jgi:hypothetical protein
MHHNNEGQIEKDIDNNQYVAGPEEFVPNTVWNKYMSPFQKDCRFGEQHCKAIHYRVNV